MPPVTSLFRPAALLRMLSAAGLALALSACVGGSARTAPFAVAPKPALPVTGSAISGPIYGSNADHADNLIDLYFNTEWDATRSGLAKWATPITVSIDTPALTDYAPFLDSYFARMRREGGVDIRSVEPGAGAISVRTAPTEEMRRNFPTAFCLVVPGRMNFDDLVGSLSRPERIDWTNIEVIEGATVFIPVVASPYQVRACLMEEIAQALGPGNDIYYLADSIFNDDGAHLSPTSFDMLALRVLYDPAMKPGMSIEEARPLVRALVDRIRPEGAGVPRGPVFDPAPEWKDTILASSAHGVPAVTQQAIAEEAVRLSRGFSPIDPRRGFSFERLGRAYLSRGEVAKAEFAFRRALAAYEISVGDQDIRVASARVWLAIAMNEQGKNGQVLDQIDLALPILAAHDTEERISVALEQRHRAQSALGQREAALQTAVIGVDWALYAFGADYGELAQNRKDILKAFQGPTN